MREGRSKATLEGFVAYSILLAGIYFFVGNVFQQTYLRSLGIHVGLIDLRQPLPSSTDPVVVAYSFVLWVFLARLPERWLKRMAELASPTLWRNLFNNFLRLTSIFATYALFQFLNLYQIRSSGRTPVTFLEYVLPHSAFLSQRETLGLCVLLGICILLSYFYYAHIRGQQLNEITKKNRRVLLVMLYAVVPVTIVYSIVTFAFVFPANYGDFKAKSDIQRMYGNPLARVEELILSADSCLPTKIASSTSFYELSLQNQEEVHFIGSYSNNQLFIIFTPPAESDEFNICLVRESNIQSIRLAQTR